MNHNDILFTDIVTLLVTFFVLIIAKIPHDAKVTITQNQSLSTTETICTKNGISSALVSFDIKDVKKMTQIYRWEAAKLNNGILQAKLDEVTNVINKVACKGNIAALIITHFRISEDLINLIRKRIEQATNSSVQIWTVVKNSSTEVFSVNGHSRLIIEVEQYGS